MQHYCPFHPRVADASSRYSTREDDEPMFKRLSFERWLKQQKIQLLHCVAHFVPGDLRRFCEHMGDIRQWDQSNKNYILTHGVSGVDWRFYKHPLPEHVYGIYMLYWRGLEFKLG